MDDGCGQGKEYETRKKLDGIKARVIKRKMQYLCLFVWNVSFNAPKWSIKVNVMFLTQISIGSIIFCFDA